MGVKYDWLKERIRGWVPETVGAGGGTLGKHFSLEDLALKLLFFKLVGFILTITMRCRKMMKTSLEIP